MKAAFERSGRAAGLMVPDKFVAAMHADVVESADLVVRAAHHDHRRPDREVLEEVVAGPGNVLDPANLQPDLREQPLLLEAKIIRRQAGFGRNRRCAEIGGIPRSIACHNSGASPLAFGQLDRVCVELSTVSDPQARPIPL